MPVIADLKLTNRAKYARYYSLKKTILAYSCRCRDIKIFSL